MRNLIEFVEGVPVHFVFNVDEMGYQNWPIARGRAGSYPSVMETNTSIFQSGVWGNGLPWSDASHVTVHFSNL
jgi:hypothetical protein